MTHLTSVEPDDDFVDDPAPTLTERAKNAQDQIGWTSVTDHMAMASAVIELARVVVTLTGTVERLEAQVATLTAEANSDPWKA